MTGQSGQMAIPEWLTESFYVAGLIKVRGSLVFVVDAREWKRIEFQNMLDKHAVKRYEVLGIYARKPVNDHSIMIGTIDTLVLQAMNPKTPWQIHDERYGT
jgi:hypothetical protein